MKAKLILRQACRRIDLLSKSAGCIRGGFLSHKVTRGSRLLLPTGVCGDPFLASPTSQYRYNSFSFFGDVLVQKCVGFFCNGVCTHCAKCFERGVKQGCKQASRSKTATLRHPLWKNVNFFKNPLGAHVLDLGIDCSPLRTKKMNLESTDSVLTIAFPLKTVPARETERKKLL